MKFKRAGTTVAALALLATSFNAEAADIPRPVYKGVRPVIAYYNWTGFYAGINAGYGFGRSVWDVPAVTMSPKGFMVGGTLGYNWQTGSVVWGIEGDLDWANVKGDAACLGLTCTTENRWLGTVRGRLGYAFDRFLPYITAGGAFGSVRAEIAPGPTATSNRFGWTAGVGLEYAFIGNWTAKIEYLYVDLGKFDPGFTAPAPITNSVSFTESIVRVGVNYKFSGPIFTRW